MNIINKIKKGIGPSNDYIFKSLKIKRKTIYFIFSEVLCNGSDINDFILRSFTNIDKKSLSNIINLIPENNVKKINTDSIFDYLNNGFLLCIINNEIFAIEVRARLDRGVNTIESEISITGPKDSFCENFNINLGLIRRRIKSNNLWWEELNLGSLSKTKVGILYIDGVVNYNIVANIKEKLNNINIDSIIDSSYLKDVLEDNNNSFFPTIMSTERPDKASMALLEGKVVIIVDTSSYVLILPNFFIDFFHTVDDYYQSNFNIIFNRIIRVFAFFVSIFLPALYIAVTTYNQDSIPLSLLLLLKVQRHFVPFPAVVEALFMIISFEILRESDIRMSSTTGTAISILGGLILGDAAVSAGIISPIMIIIIALSSIAGFVFTSVELINALRFYRILTIVLACLLGIYGIYISGCFMLFKLITLTSLNKPYLAPFSPFIKSEQKDAIYKEANIGKKYRNPLLTNNKERGNYK